MGVAMGTKKTVKSGLIAQDSTDMEFRKTNESIGLRVKEGKFSLLSRKLYNVLVFHAQKLKTPGQNAPIDTAAAKKYFWIPLVDVARRAVYDSKDSEFLKQHLEELQNIKVHMEDDRQWTSERLISSVKLVNPAGLGQRGGMLWIGFAFPPEVFEMVMAPNTYTKLSIYYQGLLKSVASLALYEICRRYATNPSKLTMSGSYEYWYSVLSCSPARDEPPPYKYFKRDVLKPGIAEINASTDIDVELIEHKNGRKVVGLQFHVELKRQPGFEFAPPPVINGELIAEIMRYGFSQTEAADMTVQYPEEKLRNAISVVVARAASRSSPPLDSPAAYLRWALRHPQESLSKPSLAAPKVSRQADERPIMERFLGTRGREAFALFDQIEKEDEQALLLCEFKKSPYSNGIRLSKGVTTRISQTAVGMWYANYLWGEPNGEALAAFVEMGGRR